MTGLRPWELLQGNKWILCNEYEPVWRERTLEMEWFRSGMKCLQKKLTCLVVCFQLRMWANRASFDLFSGLSH